MRLINGANWGASDRKCIVQAEEIGFRWIDERIAGRREVTLRLDDSVACLAGEYTLDTDDQLLTCDLTGSKSFPVEGRTSEGFVIGLTVRFQIATTPEKLLGIAMSTDYGGFQSFFGEIGMADGGRPSNPRRVLPPRGRRSEIAPVPPGVKPALHRLRIKSLSGLDEIADVLQPDLEAIVQERYGARGYEVIDLEIEITQVPDHLVAIHEKELQLRLHEKELEMARIDSQARQLRFKIVVDDVRSQTIREQQPPRRH